MDGVDVTRSGSRPANVAARSTQVQSLLESTIRDILCTAAFRRLAKDHLTAAEKNPLIRRFVEQLFARGHHNTEDNCQILNSMKLSSDQTIAVFENAATTLGTCWESDTHNFMEITIAMARLQAVLRRYCFQIQNRNPTDRNQLSVLVFTVPGEKHLFAAGMLELFLELQGFATELFIPSTQKELQETLTSCDHDILCISWTTSTLNQTLRNLNEALNHYAVGQRPFIVAGGLSAEHKEKWLARIGVDQTIDSAHGAISAIKQELQTGTRQKQRLANSGTTGRSAAPAQ